MSSLPQFSYQVADVQTAWIQVNLCLSADSEHITTGLHSTYLRFMWVENCWNVNFRQATTTEMDAWISDVKCLCMWLFKRRRRACFRQGWVVHFTANQSSNKLPSAKSHPETNLKVQCTTTKGTQQTPPGQAWSDGGRQKASSGKKLQADPDSGGRG